LDDELRMPIASIVIPAHDEENSIGRCLKSLLADARRGEFEIVVVCNGCRDRTAEESARFGDAVTVVETPVASKPHALNLGDDTVTSYPRIYLDADVVISTSSVRKMVTSLRATGVQMAAPELHVDLEGASWLVRAYTRAWLRLSQTTRDQVGTGTLALSSSARKRFDRFPEIMADDLFVRSLFESRERRLVRGAIATIRPPRTIRTYIRVKSRVAAGTLEYRKADLPRKLQPRRSRRRTLAVLLRDPRGWPDAAVYIVAALAIASSGRRRFRRGNVRWERDDTTRQGQPSLGATRLRNG
jgi:glycosyltransferase involved in cell wall biosynthesis